MPYDSWPQYVSTRFLIRNIDRFLGFLIFSQNHTRFKWSIRRLGFRKSEFGCHSLNIRLLVECNHPFSSIPFNLESQKPLQLPTVRDGELLPNLFFEVLN